MIIYLTGIDGSGKSTIAKEIKKKLSTNTSCELVWARYEPKFVKMIITPFKKKHISKGSDYNSMSAKEYSQWNQRKKKFTKNKLLSRVLFFIQYLEYSYQIRNILRKRNNTNLIIDRYVLDFIIDQTINYGNIEDSIWVKILLKKLKKIDKVIFIDVDETKAFSRKNDIPSIEYLTDRRIIYSKYIKKLTNGYIIENNGNISNTIDSINNII
ncbi:MAG TPA: adenylyl-sulfate kinase [Candidatus Paceibacterota bacterium]